MLWRFSASNTHLYPGARLRCLDAFSDALLTANDELLLHFSDGVAARGRLLDINPEAGVLRMPAYRTQGATDVAMRTWRIVPGHVPGLLRVQCRLATA